MNHTPKLVLASASPARRQLLENAGIQPIVQPSQFDESSIVEANPAQLVQKLALGKAEAVAQAYFSQYVTQTEPGADPGVIVLGCDSLLVMAGQIYGKPQDKADAIARWQTMRGQTGELITGHALIKLAPIAERQQLVRHRSTTVQFANLSDAEISAYVATGEPMQCAGCFTLEGRGSPFIESITGCYSNVLGLSMPLVRQMLITLGYDITEFWVG